MADCRQCADYEWCAKNEECGMFKQKQMTNADRIRSMTDEELAEWLDRLITHCNDGPCFNCFMREACLTSVLDWLKQEVSTNG